jgi:hypothetical protein
MPSCGPLVSRTFSTGISLRGPGPPVLQASQYDFSLVVVGNDERVIGWQALLGVGDEAASMSGTRPKSETQESRLSSAGLAEHGQAEDASKDKNTPRGCRWEWEIRDEGQASDRAGLRRKGSRPSQAEPSVWRNQ